MKIFTAEKACGIGSRYFLKYFYLKYIKIIYFILFFLILIYLNNLKTLKILILKKYFKKHEAIHPLEEKSVGVFFTLNCLH